MIDTTIQVKTDRFDGPLSLLLLLIQKEEMNIRDLEVTKITKQYLDYLSKMRELNFDVAGDYLFLAATLLLLKSNSCISEDDIDALGANLGTGDNLNITSETELVRRLEELAHFQKMSEKLWDLPKKGHEVFTRPKVNRKELANSILMPMELDKLTEAMFDFLQKEKRKYTVIKRDKLSIKEKLVFLKAFLKEGEQVEFEFLLNQDGGKNIDNIVITFISLLEMARLKTLFISQDPDSAKILVNVVKSLDDFDVESADGFEEENAEEGAPVILQ